MLTSQAQKDGFELDDNTLQVWLQEYTDGTISDGDINRMLMQSTQNQMGRPHLYEQLRSHLLARVYEERGLSGMFMGQSPMSGPLMTPEEQWANFLKLNRNAVASTYGLLVNDYLPMTNAAPSEEDIKATYEEGKDRDPNDQSPDPAFHRRYAATIEYVSGDFQSFLDAEVAKLKEEEIRAEYENRLKGGEFQLPETAPPPSTAAPDAASPADSTEPASPADVPAAADDAAETPESGPPATEQAPESTPEATTEGDTAAESADPASADEPASAEPSEESPDQSRNRMESAVRLVSAQQDADQGESSPEQTETSDQTPAEAEASTTTDAATETETAPATEATAADATPSDDAAPATDAGTESGTAPATDAVADSTPRVETFEDVRKQIAEEMVADLARQKMDAAMSEIVNRMRRYFSEDAMYRSNVSIGQAELNITPPKKPDLAQIAKEMGLQHEVIGPYDEVTIRDEPIARSMELGSQFLGQSTGFVQMMYGTSGERGDSPSQPLFAPVRTADGPAGKQYVAWKIDETKASTPST